MESSINTKDEAKRLGTRRVARELALRLLFQNNFFDGSPEMIVSRFEASFSPYKDVEQSLEMTQADFHRAWPLAKDLFYGVLGHLNDLDADISKVSINWTVARMSSVDRSLIRLAYYEMLHRNEIPSRVSLNEALEIAKIYGDGDSVAFINGVLNRLMPQGQ